MTQHLHSSEPSPEDTSEQTEAAATAWVLAPASAVPLSREELLARYRRERALPEEPFTDGKKPKPPAGYRQKIMANDKPTAEFKPRARVSLEKAAPKPRSRAGLSLGQTFAVAAGMALVAGAGVGLVDARFFASPGLPQQVAATAPPAAVAEADAAQVPARAGTTVISKKPVSTATLEVADVEGQTNSFIPLALHAEPAQLGSGMMLKISGVPEGAYLTSGRRDEDQIWALTLDDLKDVKLVVPKAQVPEIDLAVAAFESKTGELAAPVKTMTVALSDVRVQPASAPPPQQDYAAPKLTKAALPTTADVAPEPIPPPQNVSLAANLPEATEADALVREGDTLLKSGEVRDARTAYEKAWKQGAPDGAFGLARSYDPVVLASLDLSTKPDKDKAIAWYQRAASAGQEDAAAAIVRLKLKP